MASMSPGSVVIGEGVWMTVTVQFTDPPRPEVTYREHRVYRDRSEPADLDIGGVDYWACHDCRCVLLGQISFVEREQRRGLGRPVLAALRVELPGFRWVTTLHTPVSAGFWSRIQKEWPGEYHSGGGCEHLLPVR